MRKVIWSVLTFCIILLAIADKPKSATVAFYVAQDGNDAWSGKIASPNQEKTDGPFATLQKACNALRETKKNQDSPVTISIRNGTYFLSEPLVFSPEDSGADESPVTFNAYMDEKPIISGGRIITGWKKAALNGKDISMTEIPDVKSGKWFFHQLWINGQRRSRARYPDKGYLKLASVPNKTPQSQWTDGQISFGFHHDDLKTIQNTKDTEVLLMNRWIESHLPVSAIDHEKNLITFTARTVFLPDVNDLYYVEHSPDILDSPGEWYLDRERGILYYYPLPGEDINNAAVIAPVIPQLVKLSGNPESGKFIRHITFSGLTFSHTEWRLAPETSGFCQAAFGVPGAVYAEGMQNCGFENCEISHIGTYGLEFSRGNANNVVTNCDIFDLGAGGIKIGECGCRENPAEQTHDTGISNCRIHDGGVIFHSAIGVWIGQSYNNTLKHNLIHDFYYSGISIGWTWGYGKSLANNNKVESNHVHNIGIKSGEATPILSDMAGIYTLGIQPGTVIRNNLFHDIGALQYGGWGIYFDEGSTGIVAEKNIVYNTTHGGFHQHYGKENIIRNNIFAFGRDQQLQFTRPEPHLRFTFEKNIIYWNGGKLIEGNISDFQFAFDKNIYWNENAGKFVFGGFPWEAWQGKGMDTNSLIENPLFVNPKKYDFTLNPKSPALKLGFEPIPIDKIGIIKNK
ncbi:MAG: right-handed parallel beta-helix repeat-containing protein [Planctomycetes bacterium]|nr:right-handed parallel beta-helix repeat-containing protein [Planctomycetota bacterium]